MIIKLYSVLQSYTWSRFIHYLQTFECSVTVYRLCKYAMIIGIKGCTLNIKSSMLFLTSLNICLFLRKIDCFSIGIKNVEKRGGS
jgi:hypothetical protein